MERYRQELGKLVEDAIAKANVGRKEVCRRAGISYHQLQSIMAGNREYTHTTLVRVLWAIGLKQMWFYEDESSPFHQK